LFNLSDKQRLGMLREVLLGYGISTDAVIQPHGSGLINNTWRISDHSQDYILQKINHEVFKQPNDIAHNIESIANWLKKYRPEYLFVAPIETRNGVTMVNVLNKGYFRLFPFVKDSHTIVTVQTPSQAFEAARQFGLFTRILRDFPVGTLRITIPEFHNLTFRNKQFEHAVQFGNPLRIQQCRETIDLLCSNDHIVSTYHKIISNSQFRLRVTHHDTKISNVLFDN